MKLATIYNTILENESLFHQTKRRDIDMFRQVLKNISWKDLDIKLSPGGNINYTVYFKDKSIQKQYYNLLEKYVEVELGEINILTNKNNEIHWPQGLPKIFQGINLGFKIYKAVIDKFGHITSVERASVAIRQHVYEKLKTDPDVVVSEKNGMLIVSKK